MSTQAKYFPAKIDSRRHAPYRLRVVVLTLGLHMDLPSLLFWFRIDIFLDACGNIRLADCFSAPPFSGVLRLALML
jgi:hypothetical protein